MAFINVFLKTLGFLVGIASFIIIINIFINYLPKNDENYKFVKGDNQSNNIIAILEINGPIINNFNNSLVGNIFEYIEPKIVKKKLSKLKKFNPKVLIIKINSPGGTVSATASLEKILNDFKKENETKIYFYSDEILASGGYWIATTGDKIFSNYGSIVGSIGVSGPSWYYYDKPTSISRGLIGQKIETKNGIQVFNQNAGSSKDLYNPFRKPTDKELDHLQIIVKNIYNDFLIKVSNSRKIEINTLKDEIGALIYSGNQAKENFLIDDVLDFEQLIEKIIADNRFEDFKILEIKIEKNFMDKYLANYFGNNYSVICNKLNSNFVSLLPIFLNKC